MKLSPAFLFLILFFHSCKEDIVPTDFSLEKTSIHDISVIIDENEQKERKRQMDKIRVFPVSGMMEATGITLDDITNSLKQEVKISGPLSGKGKIKIKSEFSEIKELQYLIIGSPNKDVVYLGDVANIFSGITDKKAEERGKESGYFEFELTKNGYVLVEEE